MAFLRPGVPSTAVYLVKPLLMASIAACLICSGVSKSGSPAPRPIMSLPAAFNSAARLVTTSVVEGLICCTRSDSCRSKVVSSLYVNICVHILPMQYEEIEKVLPKQHDAIKKLYNGI